MTGPTRRACWAVPAVVAVASLAVTPQPTTAQVRLAAGTEPAWLPAGDGILVSVLEGDQRDLFVVPLDGGPAERLTSTPVSELLASWSSGGSLAYVEPGDEGLHLFVVAEPLIDWRPRLVSTGRIEPAFTRAPWTPDVRSLTVVAGSYPEVDIFRVPLDGSEPSRLAGGPGYDGSPAWCGDGRLAFVSDRGGSRDIWVRETDGSEHRLTSDAGSEDAPEWSPDGRWIAFVSDRTGSREIHVIPAAGGSSVQLTDGVGRAGYPAWSPDGSTLAYVLVKQGRGNDDLMVLTVPDELR